MKIAGVMIKAALPVLVGALLVGPAGAATVIVGNATGPVGGGPTSPTTIGVEYGADADTVGFQCDITTPAGVTLTAVTAGVYPGITVDCNILGGNAHIEVLENTSSVLPNLAEICALEYTVGAAAVDGDTFPLALVGCAYGDATANPSAGPHTETDGLITITAEGPPTITIDETAVVLPGAVFGTATSDTISVTVTPGGGTNPADTASYTCTAPAGFTVSPLTGGPIDNTGTLADIDVSCTTGAAVVNGNVECTATNTAGSSVNFVTPVTCPAGTMAAPNLTPIPAAGGTVTVGAGAPGATACGTISIAASGGAGTDEATVTCTSGDVAVTVNPAGPLTFGVGSAPQTIQVCTTLTDTAQTFTDVITCTGDDGNGSIDWAPFSVAAAAGSTAPRFVPASSLWSKLALFGIFGALGMLIIGLRRSH